MCRLAAYVGPPLAVGRLFDGPHGLVDQTWRPREMLTGTVNADGFGFAWYPEDGDPRAAVFRSMLPAWADPNLAHLGRGVRGRCLLAVVRGATEAGTTGLSDTPPFASGRLAVAHNGYIEDFRRRVLRPLRLGLTDAAYGAIAGSTDSEHLLALIADALGDAAGPEALAKAVQSAVRRVAALCDDAQVTGQLNVVATDGTCVVATRLATRGPAPSLHLARSGLGGALVASEPLDPALGWEPVPEGSLVLLHEGVEVRAL